MQTQKTSFAGVKSQGKIPDMRLITLIVPGWKNSGPDHWQTQWEKTLPHARRVEQPEWITPDPTIWHATVAHAVGAADRPVLLVAHSLGCLAVAALPFPLHAKVAGALLVAPADVERPDASSAIATFAPTSRQPLSFQTIVIASDNDPYCGADQARHFAEHWGSQLEMLKSAGHINEDAGVGSWPKGLKLLTSLRRRAMWRLKPPPVKVACLAERR